ERKRMRSPSIRPCLRPVGAIVTRGVDSSRSDDMGRFYTWFARIFRPSFGKCPPQRRPRCYRPVLEAMEDRLSPATFMVTTLADTGAGSLRAAVDAANAAGGTNLITIAPTIAGGTITLVANDTNNPFAFGPTALAIGTPTRADNLTIQGDPT